MNYCQACCHRADAFPWRDYKDSKNRTYYFNDRTNTSVWTLPDAKDVLDPYDNLLVMPLAEFVEHPIARELLHNGATLQVGNESSKAADHCSAIVPVLIALGFSS